ncbi:hypothetical protein [Chroogloeocystis siderophila]|uniref:hypothetical protein n=1 Tax=Chroogloeocystis siderophila TaxID=329163 RepID=UPI000A9D447B|nr:hypothetical protein [Chroogloeocystis siderophila]
MKNKRRRFNKMSYRAVQRANSSNLTKLQRKDQKWLKQNGYKNVGWEKVINLYHKIEELLDKYKFEELTLEELFLEADRIGNKYLTYQEREEFNHRLAKEVNEIADSIDKQFPETEVEFIDFGSTTKKNSKKYTYKSYRTVKL